jgi:hypothetical protein
MSFMVSKLVSILFSNTTMRKMNDRKAGHNPKLPRCGGWHCIPSLVVVSLEAEIVIVFIVFLITLECLLQCFLINR